MTKLINKIKQYTWNTIKIGIPVGLMLFGTTSCVKKPSKHMTEVGTDNLGRKIKANINKLWYNQNKSYVQSFTITKNNVSVYMELIKPGKLDILSITELSLNDTIIGNTKQTQPVKTIIYRNIKSDKTIKLVEKEANRPFYQNMASKVIRSIDSLYAVKEKAQRKKILNLK